MFCITWSHYLSLTINCLKDFDPQGFCVSPGIRPSPVPLPLAIKFICFFHLVLNHINALELDLYLQGSAMKWFLGRGFSVLDFGFCLYGEFHYKHQYHFAAPTRIPCFLFENFSMKGHSCDLEIFRESVSFQTECCCHRLYSPVQAI